MRETRPSGSEGGGAEYSIPLFLPLSGRDGTGGEDTGSEELVRYVTIWLALFAARGLLWALWSEGRCELKSGALI